VRLARTAGGRGGMGGRSHLSIIRGFSLRDTHYTFNSCSRNLLLACGAISMLKIGKNTALNGHRRAKRAELGKPGMGRRMVCSPTKLADLISYKTTWLPSTRSSTKPKPIQTDAPRTAAATRQTLKIPKISSFSAILRYQSGCRSIEYCGSSS
jgi:hypothetical protein